MQTKSEVLSCIQNWRRPANVARVAEAVRQQTIPSFLALVDCAAGTEWQLPPDVTARADVVFTVAKENLGPCCRFLPSCVMPHIPLTMFWLDDFLPGSRCLASFLNHRDFLDGLNCSTIGQDGRTFDPDHAIVRKRARPSPDEPTFVDVVTSAELCLTRHVPFAIEFMHKLARDYGDSVSLDEDDLLLCLGIKLATGVGSLVFCPADEAESHRVTRLPAPHALSARPDHDARRKRFIELARQESWA